MKLNGVGKGGIICLFISSAISIIACLIILVGGWSLAWLSAEVTSWITIFAIIGMVVPALVIIFGILAMVKGSQGFKIACGVLGLVSVGFVWLAWFVPLVLAIVGGILTLCGKFENNVLANSENLQNTIKY